MLSAGSRDDGVTNVKGIALPYGHGGSWRWQSRLEKAGIKGVHFLEEREDANWGGEAAAVGRWQTSAELGHIMSLDYVVGGLLV